jgi:DNA-binding XRE family transcriptional regulator
MTANEIKKALIDVGVTQAEIARTVGLSKQLVGEVIRGNRRNARIESAVATAIGKPIDEVFQPAVSPPSATVAA